VGEKESKKKTPQPHQLFGHLLEHSDLQVLYMLSHKKEGGGEGSFCDK
jgi:hypothetical protein